MVVWRGYYLNAYNRNTARKNGIHISIKDDRIGLADDFDINNPSIELPNEEDKEELSKRISRYK